MEAAQEQSPVEVLAEALGRTLLDIKVQEVLVPEGCMLVCIAGKRVHVTVEVVDGPPLR